MHDLVEHHRSQFVIATHSAILLGLKGPHQVAFEETEHYRITRDFRASPERFFNTPFIA